MCRRTDLSCRIWVCAALVAALAACDDGGGNPADGADGGDPADAAADSTVDRGVRDGGAPDGGGPGAVVDWLERPTTVVRGTVDLPEGVVAASVIGALAEVDVVDGAFEMTADRAGPSLVVAISATGAPLVMGWFGPEQTTLSTRTTADVAAYFALGGFLTASSIQPRWPELLPELASLDAVAEGLSDALVAHPDGFDGDDVVVPAAEALARARAALLDDPMGREKALLIDPSARQSGIDLDLTQGVDEVWVVNTFLRRAHLVIDRVAVITDAGEMPRPKSITDRAIEGVTGARTVADTTAAVLGAWASGRDRSADENQFWVPRRYGPFLLPNEAGALRTRYRIAVVGPGSLPTDGAPFSDYEKARASEALNATMVDVLKGFVWPLITSLAIPPESWTNVAVSLLTEALTKHAPLRAAFDRGDAVGALKALVGFLGTGGGRQLVFEVLTEALYDARDPRRAAGSARAQRLVAGVDRLFAVLGAVDLVGMTTDLFALTRDLSNARQGDVWTVEATANDVNLEPRQVRIGMGESAALTVHVPSAADDVQLEYRYATAGGLGVLESRRGDGSPIDGAALTTTVPTVTFFANAGRAGVAEVSVEVYDARRAERVLVGSARSTVTVADEIHRVGSVEVFTHVRAETCADSGLHGSQIWFYICPDLGTPDLRVEITCAAPGESCPNDARDGRQAEGPPFLSGTAEWAFLERDYGGPPDGSHWMAYGGGVEACSMTPPAPVEAQVDCYGHDDGAAFEPVTCAELEPCCPNAGALQIECEGLVEDLPHDRHSVTCANMLALLRPIGACP